MKTASALDRRCWLVFLVAAMVATIYVVFSYNTKPSPLRLAGTVSPGRLASASNAPSLPEQKVKPTVSGSVHTAATHPTEPRRSSSKRNQDIDSRSRNRSSGESRFGYILASSYFDQLTGSMANFISMQCWAATLGAQVRVVEPFIVHSTYGMNFSNVAGTQKDTKLSDLFNISEWMLYTSSFSSLASWNFFLREAPRQLIIIDRECIPKDDPLQKCEDCVRLLDSLKFSQSVVAFARKYSFKIVRRMCIPAVITTAGIFRRTVYGLYNPGEVVVIFESWGGIQQNEFSIRMGISDLSRCNRMNLYWNVPVSSKIVEDGKRYLQKYMPTAAVQGYIAVMVRIQYIAIQYSYFVDIPKERLMYFLSRCFDSIKHQVATMTNREQTQSVLLTLDSGKQGSYYFEEATELGNILSESTNTLYQLLFGNSSTLSEWNESFYNIATFRNPGYVATLQRYLAAKSRCLLTVGTGSFQYLAKTMYRTYHDAVSQTHCMYDIPDCGSM